MFFVMRYFGHDCVRDVLYDVEQVTIDQLVFFLMIRRPPRSTLDRSSAASDVYKRQIIYQF